MNNAADAMRIRHVVSIAGAVQDAVTGRRLSAALIKILEGPPAYRALLDALAGDPKWYGRRDRPDQTVSQADGIFYLIDLPPGPYKLHVSLPDLGTRFGVVELGPLQVQPVPEDGPFAATRADANLPPTRIHGTVTQTPSGNPLPGARVRLLGDTTVVKTGDDGTYDLSRQMAGKPTLQVTAARFKTVTRKVQLAAGQQLVADFALEPGNGG